MGTRPKLNVIGERVALGPMERELMPLIARWINDFGTQRTLGGDPAPRTIEAVGAHASHLATLDDAAQFAIHRRGEGGNWQPIGITELQGIDLRNGTADFATFIGERGWRGRGYGSEATRLLLGYAFDTVGFRNVALLVYEYNLAGIRAYERAGFQAFGRRRACHWMGGRFWDAILMECLASDFATAYAGG